MFSKEDTYSYKGWLISDYFLKRCMALLGYYLAATLILYAALAVIVFCVIAMAMGGTFIFEHLT